MSATRSSVSSASRGNTGVSTKDNMSKDKASYGSSHETGYGWGFGWFLLLWIILTVVIWLILVAVNPSWLRGGKGGKGGKKSKFDSSDSSDGKHGHGHGHGQCDFGRAFLAALVIAFLIAIIIGAVYAGLRGSGHNYYK